MKKVILFALCLCALIITGCDKQDQVDTVIGMWRLTSYTDSTVINDDPNTYPNYYLIMINDTAWEWQYEQPAGNFQTSYTGKYTKLSDNVISFEGSTGCGRYTISELNTVLKLDDASVSGCDNGITGTPWANITFAKQ